ncbi:MAG: hypothetical protein NTY02_12300 [Acidobacteria bacterium]|nr:hypothetical protein [Acidobacteriota bacterium]
MLPPWPGWDGLHPLIIHFPVALLLIAPVFLLLSMVVRRHATGFAVSALVLLVFGTAAAFVAVSTGEAAAELADRTDAITAAIMRHSALAEQARNIFAAITVIFAVLLVLPLFVKRMAKPGVQVAVSLVVLIAVLAGGLQIAAAAHQGGMLVHKLGVHAMLPPERGTP